MGCGAGGGQAQLRRRANTARRSGGGGALTLNPLISCRPPLHPSPSPHPRDIAERINHLYGGKGWKKRGGRGGRVLKVPEPFIPPAGARIMSLQVGAGGGGVRGGGVRRPTLRAHASGPAHAPPALPPASPLPTPHPGRHQQDEQEC
jgi:hypothetical protein